jgi:2-oxoglutarate/2-oxoacid ferredoxin oxidoreductase subunit beta
VHDAHLADPSYAFGLSRLTDAGVLHRAPIGIFRDVDAPAYDDLAREQVELARGHGDGEEDLQAMINGADTWLVR